MKDEGGRMKFRSVHGTSIVRNGVCSAQSGVPYGNRTRVAAVKENRPIVIQRKPAAWIALVRQSKVL